MPRFKNRAFVFAAAAFVVASGTASTTTQDILKSPLFQITNPSIDVRQVVGDLNDGQVPIVPSDNPDYDFMAQSPEGFTVYFKKDPFSGGDNIDFETPQGSIAFHTLSGLVDGDGNFDVAGLAAAFKSAGGYQPSANALGHVRSGAANKLDYTSISQGSQGFAMDGTYTVSPQELLEELVINSPDSISGLSQDFTVSGVYPELEPDGSISFLTDAFSQFPLVFRIPAPVMYEAGDTSMRNTGLHYDLTEISANTYELAKVIDPAGEAWLNDPSRLYPVVIDSTVVFGSAATFNAAATNYISVAALNSTAFVVGYENGTTAGDVVVGNLSGSGTTITYGAPVSVNAAATNYISVSKLGSTSFVYAYESTTATGDVKVGNITGTSTVTLGTAVVVNNAATNYISLAAASSTAFVVGFETGTTAGDLKVGNITSTSTVTLGATTTLNAAATNYISVSASSTKFVVGYENGTTAGDGVVGNITGTSTITLGTAVAFNAAASTAISSALINTTAFIATYLNGTASGNARAIVGAISGTSTITYGASTTFNSVTTTNMWDSAVSLLSTTQFVVGFESTTTSGQAIIGNLSPSFSFSISTNTLKFGNLTPSNVIWATATGGVTSEPANGSPITVTVGSSGQNGLIVSASDVGNGTSSGGLYRSVTQTIPAAISFVQAASLNDGNGATSHVVTFSASTTPGDILIATDLIAVPACDGTPFATSSLTDSQGNVFTLAQRYEYDETDTGYTCQTDQEIWWAPITSSTKDQVTFTHSSNSYFGGSIMEYRGVATSSPVDIAIGSSTSVGSAALTSGLSTTANAYDLLIGAGGYTLLNSTYTAGAGYTIPWQQSGSNQSTFAEYRIVSNTGSYAATGTASTAGEWGMTLTAFKQAASVTSSYSSLIPATGSLVVAAGVPAYALYVKNVGSALTAASGFNGGSSTGAITTSAQTILSASGPVSLNNSADIAVKASIAATTTAGSYGDTITITATGKY